jgi:hypothetical protein
LPSAFNPFPFRFDPNAELLAYPPFRLNPQGGYADNSAFWKARPPFRINREAFRPNPYARQNM